MERVAMGEAVMEGGGQAAAKWEEGMAVLAKQAKAELSLKGERSGMKQAPVPCPTAGAICRARSSRATETRSQRCRRRL